MARRQRCCSVVGPHGGVIQCFVPEPLESLLKRYGAERFVVDALEGDFGVFNKLLPCLAHNLGRMSNVAWLQAQVESLSSRKLGVRKIARLNARLRRVHSTSNADLRSSIAWVGGPDAIHSYYVPPAPKLLPGLMKEFVRACNTCTGGLNFAKVAVILAWFLLVHPFEDGNGRTSRVILAGLCCSSNLAHFSIILSLIWMYRSDAIHFTGALQKICIDDDWHPYMSLWSEGFEAVYRLGEEICSPEFLTSHSLEDVVQMARGCKPSS